MIDLIFQQNSLILGAGIFVSITLAIEFGYRLAMPRQVRESESQRGHINAIQGSLLGFLALILGFTLSLSLQRFDNRSEALVAEANAIGTAWLRAQFLPASVRVQVQALLRQHLDLRVRAANVDLAHESDLDTLWVETDRNIATLWSLTVQVVAENPDMRKLGLFAESLNDMIDAFGRREASLARHVPYEILSLLWSTFVLTGGVMGYAVGVAGHRPSAAAYVLVALITALSFVIIDLDRPRRGLIQIDQSSLVNLGKTIDRVDNTGRGTPMSVDRPFRAGNSGH